MTTSPSHTLHLTILMVCIYWLGACSPAEERQQNAAALIERRQARVDALFQAAVSMTELDGVSLNAAYLEQTVPPPRLREQRIKMLESDFGSVYVAFLKPVAKIASSEKQWVYRRLHHLARNQPRGQLIVGVIMRHLDNYRLGINETPTAIIQDFQTLKYTVQ